MTKKNDALRRHLALVEELELKFSDLSARRAKFAQQAAEADRAGMAVQALKAERHGLLGRIALDAAPDARSLPSSTPAFVRRNNPPRVSAMRLKLPGRAWADSMANYRPSTSN